MKTRARRWCCCWRRATRSTRTCCAWRLRARCACWDARFAVGYCRLAGALIFNGVPASPPSTPQLSVHEEVLQRLRRSCEVALQFDRTLSAPRLAALLTFAADKAQQLFQELGPLRRGGRQTLFSESQHRTAQVGGRASWLRRMHAVRVICNLAAPSTMLSPASLPQAGLPQQGEHTQARAAALAQVARTSSASQPLTATAALRRTTCALLLPRLKVCPPAVHVEVFLGCGACQGRAF